MKVRPLPVLLVFAISLLLFFGISALFGIIFNKDLTVLYPFDGAVFPPEIASPTVTWQDSTNADRWLLTISFQDGGKPLTTESPTQSWTPERGLWESIKTRSAGKTATFTIEGKHSMLGFERTVSSKSFSITTSKDEVGAPIFFRSVTLPFEYAVNNVETIKWCLGDISSYEPPRVVLENLPVCGNCHSFSSDGAYIGMDVDYANDKGSYIVAKIEEHVPLTTDTIITWSDYRRSDNEPTYGLLSQVSPDGRYTVSTVKDRSVFVAVDDEYYSQLFFPIKGMLAYYDKETEEFHSLPGADDKRYVQSNPSWSPDGKTILFARHEAEELPHAGNSVLLTRHECEKYLSGGEKFKFDLYRIPFNEGTGGASEPVPGASDNGMSNYFGKYSPDGKWIVFCKAESFMLLQPDSRLFIMPAEGGQPREMNCNTDRMNSWHSWSPNGKWMVFSSKKFSPYTQLFLTHIDENGNDSPPVLLSRFTAADRAANIPEFVNIGFDEFKSLDEKFVDYYSYFRLGEQSMKQERYSDAERYFRKSIAIKPDFALAHRKLGTVLSGMGRIQEAFEAWKTSLQLDPKDALTWQNVGTYYLNSNRIDDAEQAFSRAVKLDSHCEPALNGLGIVEMFRGNTDKAEKTFHAVLAVNSESEEALYRLGTIYMSKKDFRKAQDSFHSVLAVNPDHIPSLKGIGFAALNNGDWSAAEKAFRHALAVEPDNPDICFMLGKLLAAAENTPDESIALLRKTIALKPSSIDAYLELSKIYVRQGEREKARDIIRQALMKNPESSELLLMMKALSTGR